MVSQGTSIAAIEAVYRRRGEAFFRFALARTGSHEPARDAVQEGFARAIRSRRTFRGTGSLEAWICRCVINAAHDLIGKEPWPCLANADERSEERAIVDESVRSAIRALPPRQREALFLRFYLDFDYAAIAEALDIEPGTVSATLSVARSTLAERLKEVLA